VTNANILADNKIGAGSMYAFLEKNLIIIGSLFRQTVLQIKNAKQN
jgi:hypothetical protein